MPSLVLLNVSQSLFDQIKEFGRRRRLGTDDAAIELIKLALDSTQPPQSRLVDEQKGIGN
jgi:hypothetical protein